MELSDFHFSCNSLTLVLQTLYKGVTKLKVIRKSEHHWQVISSLLTLGQALMTLVTFWWHLLLFTKLFYQCQRFKIIMPNILLRNDMLFLNESGNPVSKNQSVIYFYQSNISFMILLTQRYVQFIQNTQKYQ